MAFSGSSVFLMFFSVFLFLIGNVRSNFSFNFPNFDPATVGNLIGLKHDATISNSILQLTKKDENGEPIPNSVGQSVFMKPIQIYDKASGKVADFATEFYFVVNRRGRNSFGDGMTFFLRSVDFNFPDVEESGGGFLGIFTHKPSKTKTVAVEFDTFRNQWDDFTGIPHIGIDVGSVVSEATVFWFFYAEPDGAIGHASISYDSNAQELSVSVNYPKNGGAFSGDAMMKRVIDLRAFLPERVLIGFSAATGDLVETHDILSWSFTSNL